MLERWLDIPGYAGRYQVSDLGRVRSLNRRVRICHGATRPLKGRILRPAGGKSGHVSVALGKGNSKDVHVLVLRAFVGPPPKEHEALHLNHKPADNRLSNLKWGTRSENMKMEYAAGRRKVHPNFKHWRHIA